MTNDSMTSKKKYKYNLNETKLQDDNMICI